MSIFKLIGGVIFDVALFGGLLFLPAGTLDWWRAWVFVGVVCFGAALPVPEREGCQREFPDGFSGRCAVVPGLLSLGPPRDLAGAFCAGGP